MNKNLIGLLLLLGISILVIAYISSKDTSVLTKPQEVSDDANIDVKPIAEPAGSEDSGTLKAEGKSASIKSNVKNKHSNNTGTQEIDENEIYEDVLRSVVDEESFKESQNKVLLQYENDVVTPESRAVRTAFYNKVYSTNAYDSLLEKHIKFSDVSCKKTLCRVDFEIPQDGTLSGFEIPAALIDNKLINLSHGASFHSEESDGSIQFYIDTQAISR